MKRSRSVDEENDENNKKNKRNEDEEENRSLLNGMEAMYTMSDFPSRKVKPKEVSTNTVVYDVFTEEMERALKTDHRGTAPLVLCLFGTNMNMKEFKRDIWRQRALVTRGSSGRFEALIRMGMFDLDLQSMLEATSSEAIHAWLRPLRGVKRLDSVRTDSVEDAMKFHRSGASLYFRASHDLEKIMLTNIQHLLNLSFSASYSDGTNRSEIETFVSRRGHCTDWHFDFQQNFTLQLKGKKTWYLARGTGTSPLRGQTPHYKEPASVIEMQAKIHKYCNKKTKTWSRDFESEKHVVETVTLSPGDSLYFPSGMWHKVVCDEEDSISINLSIKAMRYCDLVSSAIRQVMFRSEMWRSEICQDTVEHLPSMLKRLVADIQSNIKKENLIPPVLLSSGGKKPLDCMFDRYKSRVVYFDDEAVLDVHRASKVAATRCYVKNPLAVLIQAKEIEHRIENMDADFENESMFENIRELSKQHDDGAVFILHVNFGDENLESLHRTIFVDRTADQKYSKVVNIIMSVFAVCTSVHECSLQSIVTSADCEGLDDAFDVVERILRCYGYMSMKSSVLDQTQTSQKKKK